MPVLPAAPRVLLLLTLALSASRRAAQAPVAPTPSSDSVATVRIAVRHDDAPVEGAVVRSAGAGTLTDASGAATLRLAPGTHRLVTTRLGFVADTTALLLRAAQDTAVVVTLREQARALDAVVVGATRSERRIEDEPIRVEVIDEEEIAEKVMMTPGDVAMMLNETSGLRVQTTSPSLGGATVRVQGLAGRYTQILSDGLPLYGGQAGGLGLLQIPPLDLGRVEIIKGASSALYGSNALGGVVNLVSRRAGQAAERELLLNRTSRGGTDGVAWLAGPLSPRWGYTLLAGAHGQEQRDIDGDAWTDLPGYRRMVIRPRLAWDARDGRSVLATAGATIEDREGGTLPGRLAPDGLPYREALTTRRADAGAIARWLVGRNLWSARGSAMEQQHAHRFGPEREDDVHRTGFLEATFAMPRERLSWLVGTALQRESYASEQVSRFDFGFTTASAFAQADANLRAWLALSATGRVDHHSRYGTLVNPRVSALLRGAGDWTMRASAGTGTFAPTPFTEETEVIGLLPVLPLGDLDVERATTASLDIGGPAGPVELNATLFGSRVRDAVYTNGEVRLLNAPIPTRTRGAELLARYVAEPWHVTATYTHLRATQVNVEGSGLPGQPLRREAPLVPRHAAGMVGMYELEERGRVGVELYYTGRQALEHNPYRDESRPYLIVGALVEHRVGPARLFLNLENLTDVRQTRWDPLVLPARGRGGRWTTDAWTELAGRTINGGVRVGF
jgi:iron complex outermembrane receptor protein